MADAVGHQNETMASGVSSMPCIGCSTPTNPTEPSLVADSHLVVGPGVARALNYPFCMYFDDIMSSW